MAVRAIWQLNLGGGIVRMFPYIHVIDQLGMLYSFYARNDWSTLICYFYKLDTFGQSPGTQFSQIFSTGDNNPKELPQTGVEISLNVTAL